MGAHSYMPQDPQQALHCLSSGQGRGKKSQMFKPHMIPLQGPQPVRMQVIKKN